MLREWCEYLFPQMSSFDDRDITGCGFASGSSRCRNTRRCALRPTWGETQRECKSCLVLLKMKDETLRSALGAPGTSRTGTRTQKMSLADLSRLSVELRALAELPASRYKGLVLKCDLCGKRSHEIDNFCNELAKKKRIVR